MKKVIKLEGHTMEHIALICGVQDVNIKLLEESMDCLITFRGDELFVEYKEEKCFEQVDRIVQALLNLVTKGIKITKRDVVYAIKLNGENELDQLDDLYSIRIAKTINGKIIYPKTLGQKIYYHALKNKDVVFGIGPAGTGKTYLGVVFAVDALKNNRVKKIVLTRPAVEAGENLGFLPGDLKEKVDPYLRPLYDALHDMLGVEQTERLIEKGVIEIAPLAYMRGRTLEDAYVILDEAQNTTENQMKMFLTRLGFNSKMIITGDVTQIDLPRGVPSGLIKAMNILQGVKGIQFIQLSAMDVVRHPVVQSIIERYEKENDKDINNRR
ncbi:PhoH family protein [Tannockella kyphosi]|uniref:PhoH family protein n=1 Tax=Tannockella kyphosi TaxID=2899121 RepID=UPI00201236B2|nr:PhoH family protein [Tannockella kyphosi]